MKNFLLALTLGFAATSSLFSQGEQTIVGSNGLRLSGIWGGSTNGISKFQDQTTYLNGGFFGLEFGKSLFVGGAGYNIKNDLRIGTNPAQKFELNYGGGQVNYGFANWKAVHPQIGLFGGGGEVKLAGEGTDEIWVIQPSVGIELNVTRWLHLSLDGGYRFVGDSNLTSLSDSNLSSPYAELRAKFGWSWGRQNRVSSSKKDKK